MQAGREGVATIEGRNLVNTDAKSADGSVDVFQGETSDKATLEVCSNVSGDVGKSVFGAENNAELLLDTDGKLSEKVKDTSCHQEESEHEKQISNAFGGIKEKVTETR